MTTGKSSIARFFHRTGALKYTETFYTAAEISMEKTFGIRVTMPKTSSLRFDHLLGKDWESYRWYITQQERDLAYDDMLRQPNNYRDGDIISQHLEKVEK